MHVNSSQTITEGIAISDAECNSHGFAIKHVYTL